MKRICDGCNSATLNNPTGQPTLCITCKERKEFGFTGCIDRHGKCELTWHLDYNKLYSPDGTQHCLPCEYCGNPQWVSLPTVSVVCEYCATEREQDYMEEQ